MMSIYVIHPNFKVSLYLGTRHGASHCIRFIHGLRTLIRFCISECEREDKGFRFVGEQVSHHPPISACHAESLNDKYCYWQGQIFFSATQSRCYTLTFVDFRPKTRFWGRSIEITNHGEVHVTINKSEHYRWNKPSSRVGIAALMSQKGNLEIYGTIKITCSNGYYATLTFGKVSLPTITTTKHRVTNAQ